MKILLLCAALGASAAVQANVPILPKVQLIDADAVESICCEKSAFFSYFDGSYVYSGSGKANVCIDLEEGDHPQTIQDQACDDANKVAIAEAKRNLAAAIAAGPQ